EAMADPEHEQHQLMLDWQGVLFDPEDIEERWISMIIENFAARRRGPLQRHRGTARKKRT
ncbi:plasmid pRiA4b ORF-3 family protein, partial [Defluviimonas sp. KMU-169]